MAGPRPQRPEAMLHPGTRIPNHALLSLSHAALPLTMLSHLSVLLWLPPVIMTVERPTDRWSRGSLSLERCRIMGNLSVIDLSVLPPLVDFITYHGSKRVLCIRATGCLGCFAPIPWYYGWIFLSDSRTKQCNVNPERSFYNLQLHLICLLMFPCPATMAEHFHSFTMSS